MNKKTSHESATILIVEDNRTNAEMVLRQLSQAGFMRLHHAGNGAEGVEMTRSLLPDLVILDMLMPQMDGFEFCAWARNQPQLSTMPIIVQTSLEDHAHKLHAFRMGASDFVTKPVHAEELLARINVHLTNRNLHEQSLRYRRKMQQDLDSAQRMQLRLMPSPQQKSMVEIMYNIQLAEHYEASSMLGGDCWGMHPLSEHRLAAFMFDFSGHGMTSAMNVLRMHTLMHGVQHLGDNPGSYLSTLSRHVHPLLEPHEFATMFYGVIDVRADIIEYASAATPPLLLLRPDGTVEWLSNRGFPLGTMPENSYIARKAGFPAGAALILFSDCLIETMNIAGETISEESIAERAREAYAGDNHDKAAAILQSLMILFREFSYQALCDDLTINVYVRL